MDVPCAIGEVLAATLRLGEFTSRLDLVFAIVVERWGLFRWLGRFDSEEVANGKGEEVWAVVSAGFCESSIWVCGEESSSWPSVGTSFLLEALWRRDFAMADLERLCELSGCQEFYLQRSGRSIARQET